MSIQDDINYVKKELSADEKVLESALKIETLYNKYKFALWGLIGAGIIAFAGTTIAGNMADSKLNLANNALLVLKKDASNSQALALLKENNPKLSELYTYSQAVKSKNTTQLKTLNNSQNNIIADISKYHISILSKSATSSEYYKDLSLVERAYTEIKSGKSKEAKEKLELVDSRSSLASVAQLLSHYTIKGE